MRNITRAISAMASTVLLVSLAHADFPDPFCKDLRTIEAAAPRFESLRGEPVGMEYHGSLKLEDASQCELRNKSNLGPDFQPINDKWAYECLWENRVDDAYPAFTEMLRMCLPDAKVSTGSPLSRKYPNYTGSMLRLHDATMVVDYDKETHQLWLVVVPPGQEE